MDFAAFTTPTFAGISTITDGKHSTTLAGKGAAKDSSGYHLLVVKDYSRTVQKIPTGEDIISGHFMVGGHKWCIRYFPNGSEPSCADSISLYIALEDEIDEPVEVKFEFSFVDQIECQNPMYIHANETRCLSAKGPSGWGYHSFVRRDALQLSSHLQGDCFTVRCDIMVCNEVNNTSNDVAEVLASDIGQHLNNLLQNKVGADVIFEVNGETFAAHRCVLAARSKVFMAQLFGPMREGTTSGVIKIEDMEAKVFGALLSFIYTDSVPMTDRDNTTEEEGQDEEGQEEYIMWLQELLVAADIYDLKRLKFLCEKLLSEHIGVSSLASTLALAEQHYCHILKDECFKFMQDHYPKCLDEVMETDGWQHMISTLLSDGS